MRLLICLITPVFALFFTFAAEANDLLNATSIEGKTCAEEVQSLVSQKMQAEAIVLTYVSMTPGSFYQKYLATVLVGDSKYSVILTGQGDCDALEIHKIKIQN